MTPCRLVADKMNKNERKNKCEIINVSMGQEDDDFWELLNGQPSGELMEHIPDNWQPSRPILYKVGLGMGYLELPQGNTVGYNSIAISCWFIALACFLAGVAVDIPQGKLTQNLLLTRGVYILDCYSDVFVWIGKKSTRLVRAAALKLSAEICAMLHRPSYAVVNRCLEGFVLVHQTRKVF